MPRLAVLGATCAFVVAMSGQAPGVVGATESLLERGVLGIACVLLIAALVFKDRQATVSAQKHAELALKMAEVIALNNERMRDADESRRFPVAPR